MPEEKTLFIQAAWSLAGSESEFSLTQPFILLMETEEPWTRRSELCYWRKRHTASSPNPPSFVRELHFILYRMVVRMRVFVQCTARSKPLVNKNYYNFPPPAGKAHLCQPEKMFTLLALSHPVPARTVIRSDDLLPLLSRQWVSWEVILLLQARCGCRASAPHPPWCAQAG